MNKYFSILALFGLMLLPAQHVRAQAPGAVVFDRNGNATQVFPAPPPALTVIDVCINAQGNVTAVLIPALESWGELKCNPNERFQTIPATSRKLDSWRGELSRQNALLDSVP